MAWRQDWVDSPIEPGSQVQAWIQMWQPIGQGPDNFSRSPDRRRRSRHRHSSRGSENDSHVGSAASVRQESDFNDLHEDDKAPPAVSPHGQQQREDSQRQPYFSWDSLWKSSGWWDASRPPRPTPTLVTLTHDAPRCSPPAPLLPAPPAPPGTIAFHCRAYATSIHWTNRSWQLRASHACQGRAGSRCPCQGSSQESKVGAAASQGNPSRHDTCTGADSGCTCVCCRRSFAFW